MNEGIIPTMPMAPASNNGGDAFGGSNGWIWILLIFLLLGGNGFGGGGVAANGATNLINNDFLYTQQKVDALGQAVANQTAQLSSAMCQGFGDVRMGIADLGYKVADCCCSINRNIDQVRFENARNTCDITTAVSASTQAVKDLINSNTMQDLRDDRERWRDAYTDANQTSAITSYVSNAINQRFPYPAPANVVGFGYPNFGSPFGFPHYGGFDGYKGGCAAC